MHKLFLFMLRLRTLLAISKIPKQKLVKTFEFISVFSAPIC